MTTALSRPAADLEGYASAGALRTRLGLAGGLSFALLLALAGLLFWVVQRESSVSNSRMEAMSTLRLIEKLQTDLVALEAGCREYRVSGEETHRQAFLDRRIEVQKRLSELTSRLAGHAADVDSVTRIRENFLLWQVRVAEPIITRSSQEPVASGSPARLNAGDVLLDGVRSSLNELAQRQSNAWISMNLQRERERFIHVGILGLLALVAVGSMFALGVWSHRAYRRHVAAVEHSQLQLQQVVDHTLDGILTTDAEGDILLANPAAERLFGAPIEQVVGRHISELLPQRSFAEPLELIGTGTVEADARRIDHPDQQFPVEISLSDLIIHGERRFIAVVRDITERRRNEEALRLIGLGVSAETGEEFVQSLVSRLSQALQVDCAFIVELENEGTNTLHIMTMAEKGNICGSGPCDLSGTACEEVLHQGFRAYLSGVQEQFPCDWLVAAFAAESFVCMPLVDQSGTFIGLLGVLDHRDLDRVDIVESTLQIFAARAAAEVERKRSERSLANEKERLSVTLRSIGDGCVTVDPVGRILLFNPVAERLTGWPSEAAVGTLLCDIFHLTNVRTRRPIRKALETLIATGSAAELAGATLITAVDGTERVVETNASPVTDSQGQRAGTVLVLRDVTERFRTMEERQKAEKLESLGVAAGGIAHDFNNLLTAILGNLSLVLASEEFQQHVTDRLASAKRASLRAQELAQQLLTFAKGGAPIKQTASIGQLVRDTVTFHLRGSRIACEFNIPADLWPAEIDAGQISQVIQNLTINADQAMPTGGTLRVACANLSLSTKSSRLSLAPGRWIKITVQDEGIGIPEDHIKKIFDPYFTTKPKGSGLGLATSYSIVKAHGGVIDVVSQPGEGTVFYLFLPATEGQAPAAEEESKPAPALPLPKSARVLVLDDEEAICALVECALQPMGYEVVSVHDSNTAIQVYEAAFKEGRRFDLVISDLTIPGSMSGHEAVRKLSEIDPAVRAIVSSGYAMDPVMSRYREHGFCAMIAKPYEIDTLSRVVAEALTQANPAKVIRHDFAAA